MPFDNPYQASMAEPVRNGPGPDIPTYLVPAILTTCCCCMPFGVVAIVYAAQVGDKLASGDYDSARRSSDSAKMWCIVSACAGIVALAAWFVLAQAFGAIRR
jgi:hypothetical protein